MVALRDRAADLEAMPAEERAKAAQDLADLVESFGGNELMDVIRVGGSNDRGASQGVIAGQGAAMTGAAGDLS